MKIANTGKPGSITLTEIMKDSSRARELFKHSTTQGLYPKSFVAFMNGLIGGVEEASIK
jgi:hypothetical protein